MVFILLLHFVVVFFVCFVLNTVSCAGQVGKNVLILMQTLLINHATAVLGIRMNC